MSYVECCRWSGTYVSVDLLKGGVVDRKIASRVTSKVNEVYTDMSDANFTPRR